MFSILKIMNGLKICKSDSDVGDFEEEESSVFPQNMEINVFWKTVNQ